MSDAQNMDTDELMRELERSKSWQTLRTTPPYDEPWKVATQVNNQGRVLQALAEIELRKLNP